MSLLPGYAALHPAAGPASAISSEAQVVRTAASAVVEAVERSIALFGPKAAVISQVWALVDECAEADWDGEEGEPISERSAELTAAFIRAMPDDVPLPELAPEPDGSLSLDWIQSRSRLFSLSIGPTSRLAYAWLDGTDREHGVARFDGEKVPSRILEGIKRIMNRGNAAVRTR